MKIRNAEPQDAQTLDQMLTQLIHEEARYDSNLNAQCVVTDNYSGRIGLHGHQLLVAEADGKIVGYLYGFLYQVPDIWVQPVAILDALFVAEAYRRMGCGSMLLAEFEKFARENGACRVELKVLSENTKALALYSRLSFKEARKYMNLEL